MELSTYLEGKPSYTYLEGILELETRWELADWVRNARSECVPLGTLIFVNYSIWPA
jgi:hypothetical protein